MINEKNQMVTLNDIAKHLDISVVSVHRALQGKEGVSDRLREKIRQTADEMGYIPNYAAASMKRKKQTIAVILPTDQDGRKLYFDYIWDGIREYSREVRALQIDLESWPVKDEEELVLCLKRTADRGGETYAGVITVSYTRRPQMINQLKRLAEEGIATVVIDDDLKELDGIFCIPPNEKTAGRIAGQLISLMSPKQGTVLVTEGREESKIHKNKRNSFQDTVPQENRELKIKLVHGYCGSTGRGNPVYKNIVDILSDTKDVTAVCAMTAFDNLPVVQALEDTGCLESVRVVGADLNDETEQLLLEGKLTALINQEPYGKGYKSLKILTDFILKKAQPEERIDCALDVVLKSNVKLYTSALKKKLESTEERNNDQQNKNFN